MSTRAKKLRALVARFRQDESGITTLEFVLVFPMFLALFLATYEIGMMSIRHVMLERGVDVTVREVRIGQIRPPIDAENLRDRICEVSRMISDCDRQLRLQMVRQDPRNTGDWAGNPMGSVECVNRSLVTQPDMSFEQGGNNELMILRACARFDPVLPVFSSTFDNERELSLVARAFGIGSADSAGGTYALVTTAAFVIEPFLDEDGG